MAQANQENEITLESLLDRAAYIFFQSKEYDFASRQIDILVDMYPMDANTRFNAAKCALYAGRPDAAFEHINTALLIEPNNYDLMLEKSLILLWLGRQDESYGILNSLPHNDRVMFNIGWHLLRKGDIAAGFKAIESGRNINVWGGMPPCPMKRWDGESDLSGKRVLVYNEGGQGDEIIFARFFKKVRQACGRLTVRSSEAMKNVMARVQGVDEVVVGDTEPKNYDFVVPAMSLPYLLGLTAIDGAPYLKPDTEYVAKWKRLLNLDESHPNVGIRWQGGKLFEHDQKRTLPVLDLCNAFSQKVKLFSIQKDSDEQCPDRVVDLENLLDDWDDTVAVIYLLDAVVTSCTSVAHIAGALGKPTYVMPPIVPYFTWAESGQSTKWYDSVKVFAQEDPVSWAIAIRKMKMRFLRDFK